MLQIVKVIIFGVTQQLNTVIHQRQFQGFKPGLRRYRCILLINSMVENAENHPIGLIYNSRLLASSAMAWIKSRASSNCRIFAMLRSFLLEYLLPMKRE